MSAFDRLVPQLIDHARRLAAAVAERRTDAGLWRDARRLWPDFTKD